MELKPVGPINLDSEVHLFDTIIAIFVTPEFRAMMEQLFMAERWASGLTTSLHCTHYTSAWPSKLNQSRVHMFVCFDLVMHGHK